MGKYVAIVDGVRMELKLNVRVSSLRDPHRVYEDVESGVVYVAGDEVERGREKQALHAALVSGLPSLGQRQDALSDQLRDLVDVANRLGMYDAADFLSRAS